MAAGATIKPIVQELGEVGEQLSSKWARSTYNELEKSGGGQEVRNMFNKYWQMRDAQTEFHVKAGETREDAAQLGRATARVRQFGKHDELLIRAINLARAQGGATHAAKIGDDVSLMLRESQPKKFWTTATSPVSGKQFPVETTWRKEAGLKERSPYSPPQLPERFWNKLSGYMYLGLVAIPHLSQFLGTYPWTRDMEGFLKGISETVHDYPSAEDQMLRSGAFTSDLAHTLKPGSPQWQQFLDKFIMPGFTQTRKIETTIVAMSGKHAALNAAEDLVRAGGNDIRAEGLLKRLDIDPGKVLARGGQLTPEEIDRAMYATAREVMYTRTGGEIPPGWKMTAGGRLFTQYKDYAFNQGRFITEAYQNAWKEERYAGVAKLSAYLATIFPLAGELIWSIENGFRKLDPTDREDRYKGAEQRGLPFGREIDEYLSALGHAGGLGLVNTILRAGNNQLISRYVEPPLMSFIDDEWSGIHKAIRPNDPGWDAFFRTNLRRFLPIVGTPIAHHYFPYQFEKPKKSLKMSRTQRITKVK